jgi:hypothetical protein
MKISTRVAILAGGSLALASLAGASELYNNGAVYDVAGSPNLSTFATPYSTFGFGAQSSSNNAVAEDFQVGAGGWNVDKLTFYMYQTGANSTFTFTGMNFQITSSHADPISWTAGAVNNGGIVAYRVVSTSLADRARAIFAIDVPVNLILAEGDYVLRWSAAGSLSSGPWQVPIVPPSGGNARQSLSGGAFNLAVDSGSQANVEFPFTIHGTAVPAPGAIAFMGMGALAAGRRRR